LFVPAFGTQDRVTRYEYDRHGNVTRIIYPYDLTGQPGFEVHYFYNINGQLASIGTTDDPSRYAAYEYDLEGRVKTEHLNSRRLQRDHNYTLQGRLLSLKDGLFVEELRYRDASGNFKDGYVVGATITGAADWSRGHSYSYQYDEYGRLTAAQTVTAGYAIVPHPTWDVQGPDGHIEYDANGNLLHMNQGQISTTYQYTQETNKLKSLLRDVPDRCSFGFEASELAHFHANSEPQIFGDWYAKGVEGGITAEEKHSGTQSYQLGQNVLLSKIQVTPSSKAYLCSGWLKMQGPNQEVGIQIKASLNGPVLSEQRVPFTDDLWQAFQCMLPDAGDATELYVVILLTRRTQPPLPVYIDDVTFSPLEQDVYEHNQNGWITKNGKLDSLRYDPHAALPVDIRSGNRSTHFRYGGRGQRVLKTTVDNEQDLLLGQRLYIHGANAYPLTEITSDGETMYIYGHGGVVAVCENGQTPSFLLKDHLGSTRVVVDQKNQPIATFHYLPFGSLLPDSGNSQEAIKRFRYLYTGQEYDEDIGLYNYRARLYDSDLGRFLTPDPKRQGPSPYVYVNNNPVNLIDPTGEMFLRATIQRFIRGTRR
jgi:RHS repeat-associated protein